MPGLQLILQKHFLKNGQFYSKCAKLGKKNAVQNDFLTEQLLLVSLTRCEKTVLPVRVPTCKKKLTPLYQSQTRINYSH
jgi:hypothetical protein